MPGNTHRTNDRKSLSARNSQAINNYNVLNVHNGGIHTNRYMINFVLSWGHIREEVAFELFIRRCLGEAA